MSYPPGVTGTAEPTTVDLVCRNEACSENGYVVSADAFRQLNGCFLVDDTDEMCPECDEPRSDL